MSALRNGRLYPPGNIPGTHFCWRLSQPQGHSAAGRIMSMKKSSDTIGNRTHNLPARSAVPQPTEPPRAPLRLIYTDIIKHAYIRCRTFTDNDARKIWSSWGSTYCICLTWCIICTLGRAVLEPKAYPNHAEASTLRNAQVMNIEQDFFCFNIFMSIRC